GGSQQRADRRVTSKADCSRLSPLGMTPFKRACESTGRRNLVECCEVNGSEVEFLPQPGIAVAARLGIEGVGSLVDLKRLGMADQGKVAADALLGKRPIVARVLQEHRGGSSLGDIVLGICPPIAVPEAAHILFPKLAAEGDELRVSGSHELLIVEAAGHEDESFDPSFNTGENPTDVRAVAVADIRNAPVIHVLAREKQVHSAAQVNYLLNEGFAFAVGLVLRVLTKPGRAKTAWGRSETSPGTRQNNSFLQELAAVAGW